MPISAERRDLGGVERDIISTNAIIIKELVLKGASSLEQAGLANTSQ